MGILSILSVILVGGVAVFVGFMKYALNEIKDYKIDYSNAAGKVIIITGANSGLGYHTAVELANAGSKVILACRSKERCEEARKSIIYQLPNAELKDNVKSMTLDLSSFASVREFVTEFNTQYDHVDVLVNNAGIMALPEREVSKDGLEAQIATNHFGHFLLTSLLYPRLAKNGRIINHSSGAHMLAAKDFVSKDLLSEQVYDPWVAYGNSKLANLFFTYELNRRLEKAGNPKNIISIAVHPGYTATNLQKSKFPFWEHLNNYMAMKGEDGALSQIFAAVDPKAVASKNDYIGPVYIMFGKPAVTPTADHAWNETEQKKLWEASVRITDESFQGL